jgi:HEAT repeat protein
LFGLSPLPRNIAAALRDMQSRRTESRRTAIVDLIRFADTEDRPQVLEALRHSLLQEPEVEVRAMAALAAAEAQLGELLPELLQLLEAATPRVQQMALLAIGELGRAGDGDWFKALRPFLRSDLPALRYQALVAWRRLAASIDELVDAANDPDSEVRFIAWSLLDDYLANSTQPRELDKSSGKQPDIDEEARASLLSRLATLGQSQDERTRILAAAVLWRLGDCGPMTRLIEDAERSRRWSRTQQLELILHCGRLRAAAALPWLKRLARVGWLEGSFGWPATASLAAIGDQAARRVLFAELEQRSLHRRARALRAVQELGLGFASDELDRIQRYPGEDEQGEAQAMQVLKDAPSRSH